MLSSLHIENIAVIKMADIGLYPGFTVITGETGAGKSIVIDSINLILGARAQKELVRSGENEAMVSAVFNEFSEKTLEQLDGYGIKPDEEKIVIFQRNITSDGRGTAHLNGRQITLSTEREAAKLLVNIHGQHDNQLLLDPSSHIDFLDAFAGDEALLTEYSGFYRKLCDTKRRLSELNCDETEKARMIELLKYQLSDIDSARLKPDEEESLIAQKKKIQNLEKISKQCVTVYRALYQNEKGVSAYELVERAEDALNAISEVTPEAAIKAEKLAEIKYALSEIAEFAYASFSMDGVGDPTALLDKIEGRLDTIAKLRRKYGATINDILAYRTKAADELKKITMSDELIKQLEKQLAIEENQTLEAARKLTEARKNRAAELEKKITAELKFLEMGKVSFYVDIKEARESNGELKLTALGADEVEFLIMTNPGEPAKPLAKIASGGELSRIMLALKCVFAGRDEIPTLIFDEIDTGVSGKTLQKIGIKLKQLSRTAQVICVTHSAQIAALADNHMCITKHEIAGRVETEVKKLDRSGRINEIARIMGGENISETLLKTAEEMLDEGQNI